MVSVIRDMPEDGLLPPPRRGGLWKFMLLVMVVASLALGYYYNAAYGARAWVVFGIIAIVGFLLFLLQIFKKPETGAFKLNVPVSHVLERVFARSPYAGLIVEKGRAVRANDSYLELAESLGLGLRDGVPPLPEHIFENAPEETKSAIYRLSHLEETEAFGEEEVEYWSEDGRLLKYLLRLTIFKGQQYWEILDYTYNASNDGQLLSMAPVGLVTIHENGDVISANSVVLDWIGVDDIKSLNLRDFIEHPDGLLDSPKEADRLVRFDTRLITHKQIATPVVLVANWFNRTSDRFVASVALHGHSSVAVQDEDDLDAMPASFTKPSHEPNISVPFAMVDLDSVDLNEAVILSGNEAFWKLSGFDQADGLKLSDLMRAAEMGANIFEKSPSADTPVDAVLRGKNNTSVSVYASPDQQPGLCRLFLVDISARKVLEDQLVQSQKMQAIGRLVAEIAHDFNNLLAAIRLYADTLLGRHPIGDPSYPELQQINANVNRAAALVKKLLAYSRKQTIRAENLDVSETLSDMAVTLKQVLGEKARLNIKHGRDLPPIRVDKSQFDTVLMNLAVNARDAMKGQKGGTITIESRMLTKSSVDNSGLKAAIDQLSGERVIAISVADTGTGITDEIKSKIFEPFFTTKGPGEGTGLGLATVYGIVQQSGGHLAVDSEIGVGTTFTIYLPEADKDAVDEGPRADAAATPKVPPPPKVPSDLAGRGHILFVEDEDSVRIIAAKTLRKRGYTVTEAADGEEAYEIIEEAETPFDLMISDVVMPGMDGPTLLKEARSMLEETRIVFISGYAEEEFSELLAEEPDVTFLPKPFTLIQLAEKVKQQIGEAV